MVWPRVAPTIAATAVFMATVVATAIAATFYSPLILLAVVAFVWWFVYVTRRMATEMRSRGRPAWLRWTVVLLMLAYGAGGALWVVDMGRHPPE